MHLNQLFYLSQTSQPTKKHSHHKLNKSLRRRLLCLALIIYFIILPGPLYALERLPVLASTAIDLTSGAVFHIPGILKSLLFYMAPTAREEVLADRLAAVSRISIRPFKFVGYENQSVAFSALPLDSSGQTIQGVRFSWESSNPDKVQIDDTGRAIFLKPGLTRIICWAGSAQATVPVLIRPGNRPTQTDAQWEADQAGLIADRTFAGGPGRSVAASLLSSVLNNITPVVYGQIVGGYSGADFLYDELYSEPRNLVGSPLNRAIEPTRIGSVLPESSNHRFDVPIVSLGGRGLAANLMLHYNSRVWARHANAITFDPVASWPSPGFLFSFGRIVTYGPNSAIKYMLIASDGTRYFLGTGGAASQNVTLKTTDGSQITYTGNATTGGALYFPDGNRADITLTNNRLVPTRFTDPDGNYIAITYGGIHCNPSCQDCSCFISVPPLGIWSITDTLGRIIEFRYDSNANLTSIVAPGLGGTLQNPVYTTVAEFQYESRNISGNFSGLTVENRPSESINVLKCVYFPATGTGYFFTYSDFGMITTTSLRRQMSAFSSGIESASVVFDYPTSGATALTDAPSFSLRTETPGGTYYYSGSEDTVAKIKTFSITLPYVTSQAPTYESQLLLSRSTDATSPSNGLLVQSQLRRGPTSFEKEVFTYTNDGGGSRQVQSITRYDDTGIPTRIDFDYDQYGNVINHREYGFQINSTWQVRRRTRFAYKADSAYINEYLRSLTTQIEILDARENTNDADDIVIAKKTYSYDDYAALGGMETYSWTEPPGHLSSYDATRTIRGNITGTTQWTDIGDNISHTRLTKYDKFGNVVKAQLSCCSERSYLFTEASYWSNPTQVTTGSPSGGQLTRYESRDFNTGLTTSITRENGLVTTLSYDSALRSTGANLPTGASHSTTYNDATLTSTSTVQYDDDGVYKTVITSSVLDGWGRAIQEINQHYGQVNITYDAMGRVASRTNPFAQGSQPGPATTFQYDLPGRPTITTLPGGNTIQASYSGSTVTVTDQVGRKVKREMDGLARMVKITEQDSAGALTQYTTYTYNLLDKLIEVNQGGQIRSYKYDASGQLLYERIPEQAATINDGAGAMWSMRYTYKDFGAVETRTDARGAVTTYGYDGMNRIKDITYNTGNAPGVGVTPNVTYTYSESGPGKGKFQSVTVGNVYQANNSFDTYGRVTSVAHTIEGRSYTTNYSFNSIEQAKRMGHMYFEYDSLGRFSTLKNEFLMPILFGASYNIAGQLMSDTLSTGGGSSNVVESFGYDTQRMQMISQTATKGSTTLMSLSYNYQAQAGQMGAGSAAGNADQLMAVSGQIGGQAESAAYTYDLLRRVVTSSQTSNGVSAQRRFVYDRWGNRTAMWDATSAGNQIQSVVLQQSGGAPTNRLTSVTANGVTVNYGYDASGNVTNDGAHTYQYDAENRVVSVDGGSAGQYAYDDQNRRVKRVAGGNSTHYLWNGNQVIAEYNGSTGVRLVAYYYTGARLIGRRTGSQDTEYLLSDRLSIRLVVNAAGSVVGRQAHLPFGEEMGGSGQQDKRHFTGYDRDSETGLDYAVNRYDSFGLGRFMSVDSSAASARAEMPQSWNRYTYALNDPINLVDPWGLEDKPLYKPRFPPVPIDPCNRTGPILLIDGFEVNPNICDKSPLKGTPTGDKPTEPRQGTVKFIHVRIGDRTIKFDDDQNSQNGIEIELTQEQCSGDDSFIVELLIQISNLRDTKKETYDVKLSDRRSKAFDIVGADPLEVDERPPLTFITVVFSVRRTDLEENNGEIWATVRGFDTGNLRFQDDTKIVLKCPK